ncbi:MAG TPA: plasmid stability protein [Gammaproteobacteria bacterium]|nr:plasmid stability protein [Gammaproteobacteria bacterium]
MSAVTVRNLPVETHRALKLRAARHGRSTEAEIRAILENAVHSEEGVRIGSELAGFRKRLHGLELDIERDPSPTDPARFK